MAVHHQAAYLIPAHRGDFMSGLFGLLNSMKRTMNTQQTAVNTTSHNISNANTEGFSRQRVEMSASRAMDMYTLSGLQQVGTGVDINSISRIRDTFLDVLIRDENSSLGKYQARDEFMSEIEGLTMEPSSDTDGVSSLSELMGQMWDAWQDLVNNPQNLNSKTGVVEASLSVTGELNHLYNKLSKVKYDSQTLAEQKVESLNSTLKQIDDLSRQILSAELNGSMPNDLLDKRDLLIDQLSEMMDIRVDYGQYGRVTITTSNYDADGNKATITVFDESGYLKLNFDEASGNINWYSDDNNNGSMDGSEIKYTGTLDNKGGSIAGYISVSERVADYQNRLDAISKAIATAVNTIHNTYSYVDADGNTKYASYDPDDANYLAIFTDGTNDPDENNITAGNITVNEALRGNAELLRAGMELGSKYGDPFEDQSDTRRALAIAQLKDARIDIDGILNNPSGDVRDYIKNDSDSFGKLIGNGTASTSTIGGFYEDLILKIGSFADESKNMTLGEKELVNQLLTRRDSISGVSTDEETVNLIQYQHALSAAFKVVSIVDELLDSIINLV